MVTLRVSINPPYRLHLAISSRVKLEALLLDHQIGILSVRLLVYTYIDLLANFVAPLGALYLYNV